MHLPSVSAELAREVRLKGAIDQKEFGKLILHWFPAMWSMLWTIARQQTAKAEKPSKEDEDTVPIRIMKALTLKKELRPTGMAPRSEPHVVRPTRTYVPDMVGDKGVAEVIAVMASDAMRACAEATHHCRLVLEDEQYLHVYPEGGRLPVPDLPPISLIQDTYPRACDQLMIVIADMQGGSTRPYGYLDATRAPKSCDELMKVMAINAYRLRLEREYRAHLAYQWPGIMACVPQGHENRIGLFRSSAEQILAIAAHKP